MLSRIRGKTSTLGARLAAASMPSAPAASFRSKAAAAPTAGFKPFSFAASAAGPKAAHSNMATPTPSSTSTSSGDKTSVMFTLSDGVGSLQRALNLFAAHSVNMTRIETKPCLRSSDYEFHVDFQGKPTDTAVTKLLNDLRSHTATVSVVESRVVPWFPKTLADLDIMANEILDAGADLDADHPGFHDKEYRKRREEQAQVALNYRAGQVIPRIEYTPEEIACWSTVYSRLRPLHAAHACEEHLAQLEQFEKHCGYSKDSVPQLQDISEYLQKTTGFSLRPVAGLLSTRNFLYGLAFRTFFSTQYLRHHSRPLYTPEPDIVHELMGHAPLFADPDFANLSQEIGLASIGATDEQIEQLGRCYWFSVEFGLCKQNGALKGYGAGVLSSFGEMEYALGLDGAEAQAAEGYVRPEIRTWDPFHAAKQPYPITTYQPVYYVAESFRDATRKMQAFSQSLARPFHVRYNAAEQRLEIDANVTPATHVHRKPTGSPYAKQE